MSTGRTDVSTSHCDGIGRRDILFLVSGSRDDIHVRYYTSPPIPKEYLLDCAGAAATRFTLLSLAGTVFFMTLQALTLLLLILFDPPGKPDFRLDEKLFLSLFLSCVFLSAVVPASIDLAGEMCTGV